MFQVINDFIVGTMDYVLGWLLYVPMDVAMIAVAVITSSIIVFPRKWVTNQHWLKRVDADQKRLKSLKKEAANRKDKEAVQRHKATISQVQLRAIKVECKPLLIMLIAMTLIAMWCFARLGFNPPGGGEAVELKLHVANSEIGKIGHLVPVAGIQTVDGWIQTAERDKPTEPRGVWETYTAKVARLMKLPEPTLESVVTWRIVPEGRPEPYALKMVFDGAVYERELLVGQKRYAPQLEVHSPPDLTPASEVMMRPPKLFGVIGGLGPMFPPWLVAYLIVALPTVSVLKRVFKVY
ncbi:MAG: EMC3/TMCO1 family protein [Verrucomicrobia bacterium]|nr:EMC3/TMCO1 family protein [Verrucomicrobiota bacterium]